VARRALGEGLRVVGTVVVVDPLGGAVVGILVASSSPFIDSLSSSIITDLRLGYMLYLLCLVPMGPLMGCTGRLGRVDSDCGVPSEVLLLAVVRRPSNDCRLVEKMPAPPPPRPPPLPPPEPSSRPPCSRPLMEDVKVLEVLTERL